MDFHMNNNNEDDKKCLDAHFVQAVFWVLSEPHWVGTLCFSFCT